MKKRWIWAIAVAVIALAVALAFNGPGSWAAPGQHPLWQTVPPPPTSDPGNDGDGGDTDEGKEDEGDGGSDQGKDTGGDEETYEWAEPDWQPVPLPTGAGPARFPNSRLGVAAVNKPIMAYPIDELNVGWYVNYTTVMTPARPGGVEFVQTVRVHQAKSGPCPDCYTRPYTYTMRPDAATLIRHVRANPGATWLIGNEMDRRDWEGGGQDEMTPETYAQAYGEIRALIKGADPSARVAIGGVMQATPLRLRYLDLVWDAYLARFGRRLGDDVDVWNVHGFVLPEERNSWGAGIPPGLADSQGFLCEPGDNDDIETFKANIVRFRVWMRDRGERDKPLYLTEFGINMPDEYVPPKRVKAFMNQAFDYLLTAADPELGYPPDENRLVQRAAWYSLDDSRDSPNRVEPYADALFSAVTGQRLEYGHNWAAYVAGADHEAANRPRLNLKVIRATSIPIPGGLSLRALLFNSGNVTAATADGITVRFWEGAPGGALIGEARLRELPGGAAPVTVEQAWIGAPAGEPGWTVEVESLPGEETWDDNLLSGEAEQGQ